MQWFFHKVMLHSAFLPEAVKLILRLNCRIATGIRSAKSAKNAILENQFRKVNVGGGFCFSFQQQARMSRPKKSWPSLPRIWHAKDDFLSKGNLLHNKSDAFIVTLCRKMHSVAFRCLRYLNIGGEAFLAKGHHKRV